MLDEDLICLSTMPSPLPTNEIESIWIQIVFGNLILSKEVNR